MLSSGTEVKVDIAIFHLNEIFRWAEATVKEIEFVENAQLSHYTTIGKGKVQPLVHKENSRVLMAHCVETERSFERWQSINKNRHCTDITD